MPYGGREKVNFDQIHATVNTVNKDEDPVNRPTLCRFEKLSERQICWNIRKTLVEVFIKSFEEPPKMIHSGF